MHVNIGTSQIENSKHEKRLRVNIDSKLSFEKHLNIICGKARAKINALGRVAPFMNIEKRRTIMNAFFNSQFSYCPLIWMFHSRLISNKINRLHERSLRIVYTATNLPLRNFSKKIILFQCTNVICNFLQLNYAKF